MASITLTVEDNKLNEFLDAFIVATEAVPLDSNGNPTMSKGEWVHLVLLKSIQEKYKIGRQIIAARQAVIVDNIVT